MGAKNILSHSLRIAWKDLLEVFRNRLGLVMLILMPVFMMVMVGYIYPSGNSMTDVNVALVNEDIGYNGYTNASLALTGILETTSNNIEGMSLTYASSFDDLREMIQRGDVDAGIVIAKNFSSSVMNGQQGTITLVTDQSNMQMSSMLEAVLQEVFDQLGTMLAQQNVQMLGVDPNNSLAIVQPYNIETAGAIEGEFSYFDFVAPGIIAMTVMMSVMTGLPVAISEERESGTLDGMMVAPINRLSVILGKTIAQIGRGLLQGAIIIAIATTLFGVTIHGNILLVFALLLLCVFSFVGLGILLTSFTKDQETASMMMTTIMFPMMFLSGVFFPIEQMPWFMQTISKFLPLTYVADALRKVMVLGADIPAITTELSILIVFGVTMIAIAVPVFKRAMTR
ncbi:MAG: ABC transporter permease [Candidatus Bathyarchaeota archaeon]|nr:ABC transporter permease [Candidatus Bathyarchaeum sp.]